MSSRVICSPCEAGSPRRAGQASRYRLRWKTSRALRRRRGASTKASVQLWRARCNLVAAWAVARRTHIRIDLDQMRRDQAGHPVAGSSWRSQDKRARSLFTREETEVMSWPTGPSDAWSPLWLSSAPSWSWTTSGLPSVPASRSPPPSRIAHESAPRRPDVRSIDA